MDNAQVRLTVSHNGVWMNCHGPLSWAMNHVRQLDDPSPWFAMYGMANVVLVPKDRIESITLDAFDSIDGVADEEDAMRLRVAVAQWQRPDPPSPVRTPALREVISGLWRKFALWATKGA